jgi:hypothetical protein
MIAEEIEPLLEPATEPQSDLLTEPLLESREVEASGPRIDRAVLAWGRWYTSDLPDELAADRIAELESDVYEERAAADGAPGVGRSILARAVRGIPADLAWRFSGLRGAALGAPHGTFPLAMPALAHLATALLLTWGVLIVVRVVEGILDGSWSGAWDLVAAGVVGLAMALVGAAYTTVPKLRWLGALWLAAASYVLIRFGMYALIASSVTLNDLYASSIEMVILVNRTLAATGVLFFVSMAVWWLPSAKTIWSVPRTPGAPTTEGVAS